MASLDNSIIHDHLYKLVRISAEQLDRAMMVRYNPVGEGLLDATHLGRIASHFYIQHETIVLFNEMMKETMDVGHLLDMMSRASEFKQLRVSNLSFFVVLIVYVFFLFFSFVKMSLKSWMSLKNSVPTMSRVI